MDYRTLGRTGVEVSPLCLGAMMFGAWGNPDHDDSIRIIHRASTPGSTSSTPPTSTRAASPRRSSARRSPAGATTSCWRRSSTAGWATGRTGAATRGAGSCRRSRTACAGSRPTGSTSTRSTGPTQHRHRRDARCADRPRPGGEDPLLRQLDVSGAPDRRGAVGRREARPGAVRHRAASLLAARPRDRARRAAGLPAVRDGRPLLEPARRRLAHRPLPQGPGAAREHAQRAAALALRHVAAREPARSSTRPTRSPRSPTRPGSR